jgi:hypothetical protein
VDRGQGICNKGRYRASRKSLQGTLEGLFADPARESPSDEVRLHLPPNVPVKTFWSLSPYDTQTRSVLQTDQRDTALSSESGTVKSNPAGSVDVYFGPTAPAGRESNWIQTEPNKGWFTLLRLYGALEPWFDKTWRPGEIELVK